MALMVYDSDLNAAKTCFVHVKSGGQMGLIDPSWPRDSAVYDLDNAGKLHIRYRWHLAGAL